MTAPDEAQATRSARRILIVDDNEDAADLLSELLADLGHHTQVANDGPTALRIAAELKPDVVLLDLSLPVMDGYEVARRLRALPTLEQVRLIAVTGHDQVSDRQLSSAAGFDAHLGKPLQLAMLQAMLLSE